MSERERGKVATVSSKRHVKREKIGQTAPGMCTLTWPPTPLSRLAASGLRSGLRNRPSATTLRTAPSNAPLLYALHLRLRA